ncbi:myelin protein zero-like protein 2 [Salmo salar]|uniref:Myelin protein zero-like protein 2 n=1 Tax=Salmo salar TaxID=8030 RepID=A0ABM3EPL3_SALSA|nr:myelin protein zero-like protein 2 [Salmo salar]
MYRTWLQFLALLGGFAVPGVLRVGGMEVFMSNEVEAVNGTEVRLKCTFKSKHPVSLSSVTVSWNFRPLGQGAEESVFYYQETAYPPTEGRFKGHAVWSGDILRQDASISLQDVPFTFNGTYTCQVRNLPDVHGINGEVTLRVVHKVSVSEIGILAVAIGAAIAIVLVVLCIFVVFKYHKLNRHANTDLKLQGWERELNARVLEECKLNATVLEETKLNATVLEESELNARVLEESELNATVLEESKLNATVLEECKLNATVLEESKLNATVLEECKLNATVLEESELNATVLEESKLNATVLEESKLNATVLEETKLNATVLEESELNATVLEESKLNAREKKEWKDPTVC